MNLPENLSTKMKTARFTELFAYCSMKRAIYKQINPVLFDVSLRDGIQGLDPYVWNTEKKKELFLSIFNKECPSKIEVGSLVSGKVLPIMGDSIEIHNYVTDYLKKGNYCVNPYMLVPNAKKLRQGLNYGIDRFSFITSVSEDFQKKNTNMSLRQVKDELAKMDIMLLTDSMREKKYAKLYISCIDECPIRGKISVSHIVNEIIEYNKNYSFDELCLSDTCGSLEFEDFYRIIDKISPFVPLSKISLHLHDSGKNTEELHNILFFCFNNGINKFDVSAVETGGCSVSMNGRNNLPNLNYDLFYRILDKYIERELS
jgi:hypothetical protein